MNIPKHWQKIRLGDIVLNQKGKKPHLLKSKAFADSIPYLDIEAVERNNIMQYADKQTATLSTDKDIFVLRTGGRNGLILKGKKGAVGSTFFCLTPLINSDFLFHYLKSIEFKYSGTRDLYNDFWDIEIPLPPLEEQRRIVDALELQLAQYQKDFEEAKAELERLGSYKKSILEDAISGKLTAEWRRSKNLIIDIKTIEEIASVTKLAGYEYTKFFKPTKKGEIPLVRAQNINKGFFEEKNMLYISKQVSNNLIRSQVKGGEILMVYVGGSVGNSCVAPKKMMHLAPNVAKITLNNNIVPEYLNYYFLSNTGHNAINKLIKSVAQPNLSMADIKQIEVIVFSIEEQKIIIQEIENQLKRLNLEEKEHKDSLFNHEELKQSIFQLAFSGQLSQTQATDTSITTLLEQIKGEKENLEKQRKEIQKENVKKRPKMNNKTKAKKSIIEILAEVENQELTSEEAFESSGQPNIAAFYKDLRQNLNAVSINKIDDKAEGIVLIKLKSV